VSPDDTEARKIAGYVKTVVDKDFVGVVAETEGGNKAAKAIVSRDRAGPGLPEQKDLYTHMRSATPKATRAKPQQRCADGDSRRGEEDRSATTSPFQSHATMGPGCGRLTSTDGVTTVWSGAEAARTAKGSAQLLGVPVNMVRVV
jgi:nicotinate dehydrogenase subunit B